MPVERRPLFFLYFCKEPCLDQGGHPPSLRKPSRPRGAGGASGAKQASLSPRGTKRRENRTRGCVDRAVRPVPRASRKAEEGRLRRYARPRARSTRDRRPEADRTCRRAPRTVRRHRRSRCSRVSGSWRCRKRSPSEELRRRAGTCDGDKFGC